MLTLSDLNSYDFKGEDANPRWAYPDIKEVVYLDGPTISEGRTWHCPKLPKQDNETGTTPDPSEAEYRTRTLIIPYLVQLTINNTNFFPALFGCANNTDASFPSFSPSPIEAALNEYGKKVEEIRICKNDVVQKVNTWSKDQEDYEELDHCYSIGKFYKWFKSCQPFITPEGTLKELLPVGDKPLDDCDDKAKWVLK
ncbi:uncharacterized protein DFL_008824 [Arthrobotrys flagrans]|uniref:Uncharacterized protein n=1 Tax=Arthrobotrys flagrans TaxID=97331 RepID=A0A436ZPW4_ARTFL|nr:hypothetical protein DFL_008824 [Arthrobotrys flagrans]